MTSHDTKSVLIQGLQRSLQRALDISLLRGEAMDEVISDRTTLAWSLGFVAVAGLVVGLMFTGAGVKWLLVWPILTVAILFLCCLLLHLVATRLFGGTGDYIALCRVSGFLGPLHWLRLIPLVGWFATIWSLVVEVVVLERVYRLTREKAIACFVVFLVVSSLATWAAFKLMMRPDLLGMSGQPTGALYEGVPPPFTPPPPDDEPAIPQPPLEEFTAPPPEEETPPHPTPLPPGEREQDEVAPEAEPE